MTLLRIAPLLLAALAQQPAVETPADKLAASLASARKALSEGKREDAFNALKTALAQSPASQEALQLCIEATKPDEDAQSFWLFELARATLGPERTNTLDSNGRRLLGPPDSKPNQVANGYAGAFEELARFAKEREKEIAAHPEAALVALWARRAALDLGARSPLLERPRLNDLDPRLASNPTLPAKALRALEHFADNAAAGGRMQQALAAALILKGCATQAGWDKDLQGPKPPGIDGIGKTANDVLGRARAAWEKKAGKPWSIEELEALGPDEREAFTRRFGDAGNPATALSPRSWYKLETDCGHATLLGAAQTVELHHQRLANWYAKDPFVGRQGLMRIVPEAGELEAAGAPFWWAGGFQGGDTTTLRFSCGGTIEGLGHGITHELTHRFDGAIYPGLPAWMMEGKAVWTGGAYGKAADTQFVDNYASFGGILGAYIKGYGGVENLTKLLDGTIEDYRDNYSAGHALFVYLRSRKNAAGHYLYRELLPEFQQRARGPKKGAELFASVFLDGKNGRAAKLDKFCEDWSPWLGGFYWFDLKPWAKELTENVGGAGSPEVIEDPVWGWYRSRAEPRFGQGQAERAGDLLREAGARGDAITAYLWALGTGSRIPNIESELADELDKEGRKDSAWCLRNTLAFPFAARNGTPPFLNQLPKTAALLATLEAAANDARARKLATTTALLVAERERIASWLGTSAIAAKDAPVEAPAPLVLFDGAAHALGRDGWNETGLTGFEERRAKGCWCTDEEGTLFVGVEKVPGTKLSTGDGAAAVDRGAAWRDAFAIAPEWVLPGSWRLDCRIRFLSSYASGAVVFGYREREDNLRFSFGAGDFNYAAGITDKLEHDFSEVGGSLSGLRDRDGGLIGGTNGGSHKFDSPRSSFWLTLVVDGPFVEAFIDNQPLGRYHAVDGAAIEGQIGFATGMGAVAIEGARVTRTDRSRLADLGSFASRTFDLSSAHSPRPWSASMLPSCGLPRTTQGTLLYWIPPPETAFDEQHTEAAWLRREERSLREFGTYLARTQPTQDLLVALPPGLSAQARAALEAEAKKQLGDTLDLRAHAQSYLAAPPESGVGKDFFPTSPWLCFVDNVGCLRACTPFHGGKPRDDARLTRWLEVFRDNGHPRRELPELVRETPADPGAPATPGKH
ncbi:MAG: hypothetical protein IPJ19_06455 [Planctomycetes bacterium]|nr:hypothetical protein [Planctomycetota bacterium]